ncbi:MAG: hypothetical protein KJ702_10810 [Gammaproteobacteria bacterium]|nr:hypothetical protein [Gammaproteobacteria bacterium]
MNDFFGMQLRTLPEAIYDLAVKIYPCAGPDAVRRLVDSLSGHDLRMLETIALRDGPEAAEQFYLSRPRRLRVIKVGLGHALFR